MIYLNPIPCCLDSFMLLWNIDIRDLTLNEKNTRHFILFGLWAPMNLILLRLTESGKLFFYLSSFVHENIYR